MDTFAGMTNTLTTKFEIVSWDENAYRELEDGSKFTKADVSLESADDLVATYEGLMYYRPDGSSSYVTLMSVTGTLGGKQGTFVLQGEGIYDGTQARGTMQIIEHSATEELAGLTGSAESVSTHEDYPFMPLTLKYAFEGE